MSYNVKPGDHAEIVDSIHGPNGASVGRRVLVHADAPLGNAESDRAYVDAANALNDPHHYCPPSPYEKEHTGYGKIWPVTDLTGKPFADVNGNLREYGEVPDRWLRKIEPPPPAVVKDDVAAPLGTSTS